MNFYAANSHNKESKSDLSKKLNRWTCFSLRKAHFQFVYILDDDALIIIFSLINSRKLTVSKMSEKYN